MLFDLPETFLWFGLRFKDLGVHQFLATSPALSAPFAVASLLSVPRKCQASKSFLSSGTLHMPCFPAVTSSSVLHVVSFQSSGLIAQRGFRNSNLTWFPLHLCLHLTVGSLRAGICLTILLSPACSSLSGTCSKLSMGFLTHCLAV